MKRGVALLMVALGLWLVAIPLTFPHPSRALFFSDLISGCVVILLGIAATKPTRVWSGWAVGIVGFWLQCAPLFFWAPTAFLYLNDTLVGVLLIALAFALTRETDKTGDTPPGWSYNPSSWSHRIPTVALALFCWFFSRYMAAYQLGYIHHIWDPFFHDGTLNVITSKISRSFPVSDAGLGALCYTLEAVLGWQGGQNRWHTMPWLVLIFGVLVVPVGAASITLIILQPVIVGSWCAWCLATAVSMLLMIVLTAGELVAVLQFLKESKRAGKSFWKVLWKGSAVGVGSPSLKPRAGWGVTLPWNLIVTALLGIWLMLSPSIFRSIGDVATGDYIEGPLMVAFSVIALAEVFRSLRFANLLLGAWLILLPLLRPELSFLANSNNVTIGLLAMLLALPRGRIREKYGSWDRFIL